MPDLRGKKVLICEEALLDYKGHFYSWIKAIRRLHLDAGAEVIVAGNKNIIPEIKAEFNVKPAYTHNSWSGSYDSKSTMQRYLNVFIHNYRVYRQTRKLLKETGHIDCIILPASRSYHLLGWKMLAKQLLGKKFDRLVIFVLTSEAKYDKDFQEFSFSRSSVFIKSVISWFKPAVLQGSVILAGDSHITCGEYTKLSGVPFQVFPSPAAGLEAATRKFQKTSASSVPTFVILGVAVIDKGIDILQEAIIRLLTEDANLKARFIIQWAVKTIDYQGREVPVLPALRSAKQITLIEKVLSDLEYGSYMQEADFIVLPYRRLVYFNRLSGVAVEAACSGIPMIVTENTWLQWAMDEFGAGVTVRDGDISSLVDAIRYCISNADTLKAAALARQPVALEKNSSEKYLDLIWNKPKQAV